MITRFKIFQEEKQLICGISDKSLGNIDFRFGERKEVLANRKKLAKERGIDLKNLFEMDQVHGSNIGIIDKNTKLSKNIFPQTDALITNLAGVFLMIKAADCFPLLFFDPLKRVVAAVHVGWRGAIEKIFLEALLAMIKNFGCQLCDLKVIIGPGARKCCFVHRHYIQEKLPEWDKYIYPSYFQNALKTPPRWHGVTPGRWREKERVRFQNGTSIEKGKSGRTLDIPSFIIDKLVSIGVKRDSIEDAGICTICNQQFFSHFRSLRKNEPEGRFATVIGLRN